MGEVDRQRGRCGRVGRCTAGGALVVIRVAYVQRNWCRGRLFAVMLLSAEDVETLADVCIVRVEVGRALVSIEGVLDLILTRLVQGAEIIPDLAHVGVYSYRSVVGIQRIMVLFFCFVSAHKILTHFCISHTHLVNAVIKYANRAPKGGILSVAVHRLLVRFVGLVVVLFGNIAAAQKVPGLCIIAVGFERASQVLDGFALGAEGCVGLVEQPTILLQHFGVVGLFIEHTLIRILRPFKLHKK